MSLKRKIYVTFIVLMLLAAGSVGMIVMARMHSLQTYMVDSSKQLGMRAGDISAESVTEQITQRMQEITIEKADKSDEVFADLVRSVQVVADTVTELYNNPDAYSSRSVNAPEAENGGSLSVQVLYSAKITDKEAEEIRRERELLANAQDTLKNINQNSQYMASNYIAAKSGIMLQADYIADAKFDRNGAVLPYEAAERPWYQGAMRSKGAYFTPVMRDAHGRGNGITFGVPFYRGEEIMGVAGAGMYLDNIEEIVNSAKIGAGGDACILNQYGQIVFSSRKEGTLAVKKDDYTDLRKVCDEELRPVLERAVYGVTGVDLVKIDGESCYVAYAPMDTVNWAFLTIVPQEEAALPTRLLTGEIQQKTENTVRETSEYLSTTLLFLAGVAMVLLVITVIAAYWLSGQIVFPIRKLTEKVKQVDGENLQFSWELNSKDETQILAQSFSDMTGKMREYIANITEITAEKEKIGAELNVASRIQEDMLPKLFPAFPERREFDIYATMDPAKAVGGDFYDFFMIDEDHIGFVIADVSSKGVPAALFMVVSRTLIKNHAMSGGNLGEIYTKVNNQLCEGNDEGMFVTAWMAVVTISTGVMEYVNAGHNPQLWCHESGGYDWISARPGFVLAGLPGIVYQSQTLQLSHGDRVFLYTDGVTEAQNEKQELFGEDRLLKSLNEKAEMPIKELLPALRQDVDAFAGEAEQFDDITMLVFEYR